ncbi:unnamed protein product [Onchocerca flexuosa]|uniref:Ovule protein n=1 Tax=Onchocerca flexuosa TaxID=387005 RepID=A0A183HU43_9BILA|nr:unnamed protein product [Onchocerca flexuosa]
MGLRNKEKLISRSWTIDRVHGSLFVEMIFVLRTFIFFVDKDSGIILERQERSFIVSWACAFGAHGIVLMVSMMKESFF